jgi:hypothetical protein
MRAKSTNYSKYPSNDAMIKSSKIVKGLSSLTQELCASDSLSSKIQDILQCFCGSNSAKQ